MEHKTISVFWFRRDLRLFDNAGLYHALKSGSPVLPLFIFDTHILDELKPNDARVQFIWQELRQMKKQLEQIGSSLLIKKGTPLEVYQNLIDEYAITTVYTNRDYEPYAQARDKEVFDFLHSHDVSFKGYKDQVIFDKKEVVKEDGKPYTVYTPYSRVYKKKLNDFYLKSYPTEKYHSNFLQTQPFADVSLEDIGFKQVNISYPTKDINGDLIENYKDTRDIPSIKGTSRMSLHLRFGTVSIRQLAQKSAPGKYFDELIWRDFYQMILYHFPQTVTEAFKPQYDNIKWRNDENDFEKWCEGKTGYPMVDAGMRELNATGYMHNRVRMVVASFLTKHLLIDWRWGEAYFAEKLLDYDQASNVGGWQWAAGSGVDAAPYFRVFNPTLQLQKFDKELKYVKQWVPEYGTSQYPNPIVDHKEARERALATYKQGLA
jgi:deoxyribodipyrimidine photo-lyase